MIAILAAADTHSAAAPMFLAGEGPPALDLPWEPFPPEDDGAPGVCLIRLASKPKDGDRFELVAEISPRDWWAVRQRRWRVTRQPAPWTYYAKAGQHSGGDQVYMHTLIAGAAQTDHIDGNGLNNRRDNLRAASASQNGANRRVQVNNTSGYCGVYWRKDGQKWCAKIEVEQRSIHLGYFTDKHDAARAYNAAATKNFGDFARLNVIPEDC